MNDQLRFMSAADRLEELVPHIKEIIMMMRANSQHVYGSDAYAQVYELRREIGYVVRELGTGTPQTSKREWDQQV